jgi:GNAT superfamily N-acetyltransferase
LGFVFITSNFAMPPPHLTHRLAVEADLPDLHGLMERAMGKFLPQFLNPDQVVASYEIMGVDSRLVADQTYFMVFADDELAGCGGWSRRQTLFGGDHTSGRNPRRLNPKTEPARVRAMYTDPVHARKGVGRMILNLCETAARDEGFQSVELAATAPGVPLYKACGYVPIRAWEEPTKGGTNVPLLLMGKPI